MTTTIDTTLHQQDPGGARTPPRAGVRQWLALAVLMLPVLMVSLDNSVLSFAVPQLTESLRPSNTQLLWIIDIYPLCLASLLVTMGMLGDRIGRRRLLLIGSAGFGLVGVYAAFATSPEQLIAARALRGIFGAALMPSTLSLLRNVFLDAGQRRLAIAIWASGFAGGTALGPIVGGYLLEHFWWGSVFLLTVPVIVLLLLAGPVLLPESRNLTSSRIDLVSVAMSILAMLPVVFGIKEIATHGLDALGVAALGLGVLFGVAFVRRQLASHDPLLDVRLFRQTVFSASIVANFLSVFAFAGLIFYVSQYLQLVMGLGPMQAGTYLLPGAAASMLAGLLAVSLAKYFPLWSLITAGILIAAAGYALAVTLTPASAGLVIIVVFSLVGAGVGLAETLTNDAILSSVPAERAGAASGISETAYELGASLGVAVLGSVLASVYRHSLVLPGGLGTDDAEQAGQTIGGANAVAHTLPAEAADALMSAARTAFMNGVEVTSAVAAVLAVATAVGAGAALRRARV